MPKHPGTDYSVYFPTGDRRFPSPWSVEDPDPKLDRQCFIVRDANGHVLAYVYFGGGGNR